MLTMKGHGRKRLTPSPNEVARLLKEERERRRKVRLIQVREQCKVNAAKIRNAVKEEEQRQIQKLAEQIQLQWEQERQVQIEKLEKQYEDSVRCVGQAHRQAQDQDSHEEEKALLLHEDNRRAKARHKDALEKLQASLAQRELEDKAHIFARQRALEVERERAAKVAALPPPPPDPVNAIKPFAVRPVKLTDVSAFSTTHYHIPEMCVVDRAEPQEQVDAREAAEEEEERLREVEAEMKRTQNERREKARLRQKHAQEKETLKQDYNHMLHELSDLQRADRQRRQQVVATIPRQVYQPPHRHLVDKQENQLQMEQEFEDMYMACTDNMGDVSLALDPHPPPQTPVPSDILDLTTEELDSPAGQMQGEQSHQPAILQDITNMGQRRPLVDPSKAPDTGLKKLLGRIKAQRNNWISQSTQEPPDREARSATPSSGRDSEAASHPEVPGSSPTMTSLTQYTISTESAEVESKGESTAGDTSKTGESTQSLETGTITTETASKTETMSSVSSVSTPRNQDPATGGKTLLHPLEQAAQLRKRTTVAPPVNLHSSLEEERRRQDLVHHENAKIGAEADQHQVALMQQKETLEHRLQAIENRRRALENQMRDLREYKPLSGALTSTRSPGFSGGMRPSGDLNTSAHNDDSASIQLTSSLSDRFSEHSTTGLDSARVAHLPTSAQTILMRTRTDTSTKDLGGVQTLAATARQFGNYTIDSGSLPVSSASDLSTANTSAISSVSASRRGVGGMFRGLGQVQTSDQPGIHGTLPNSRSLDASLSTVSSDSTTPGLGRLQKIRKYQEDALQRQRLGLPLRVFNADKSILSATSEQEGDHDNRHATKPISYPPVGTAMYNQLRYSDTGYRTSTMVTEVGTGLIEPGAYTTAHQHLPLSEPERRIHRDHIPIPAQYRPLALQPTQPGNISGMPHHIGQTLSHDFTSQPMADLALPFTRSPTLEPFQDTESDSTGIQSSNTSREDQGLLDRQRQFDLRILDGETLYQVPSHTYWPPPDSGVEVLRSASEQSMDFERRKEELQEQLRNIQKQKQAMLERSQHHQSQMQNLKVKRQQGAAPAESYDNTKQDTEPFSELNNDFAVRGSSVGDPVSMVPEGLDTERSLEEELLCQLDKMSVGLDSGNFDALNQRSQIRTRPTAYKPGVDAEYIPHELSTIQEMASPEKTFRSERFSPLKIFQEDGGLSAVTGLSRPGQHRAAGPTIDEQNEESESESEVAEPSAEDQALEEAISNWQMTPISIEGATMHTHQDRHVEQVAQMGDLPADLKTQPGSRHKISGGALESAVKYPLQLSHRSPHIDDSHFHASLSTGPLSDVDTTAQVVSPPAGELSHALSAQASGLSMGPLSDTDFSALHGSLSTGLISDADQSRPAQGVTPASLTSVPVSEDNWSSPAIGEASNAVISQASGVSMGLLSDTEVSRLRSSLSTGPIISDTALDGSTMSPRLSEGPLGGDDSGFQPRSGGVLIESTPKKPGPYPMPFSDVISPLRFPGDDPSLQDRHTWQDLLTADQTGTDRPRGTHQLPVDPHSSTDNWFNVAHGQGFQRQAPIGQSAMEESGPRGLVASRFDPTGGTLLSGGRKEIDKPLTELTPVTLDSDETDSDPEEVRVGDSGRQSGTTDHFLSLPEVSEAGTGISDEPNITLVTVTSDLECDPVGDDTVTGDQSTCTGTSGHASSSLMSFEQHEHELITKDELLPPSGDTAQSEAMQEAAGLEGPQYIVSVEGATSADAFVALMEDQWSTEEDTGEGIEWEHSLEDRAPSEAMVDNEKQDGVSLQEAFLRRKQDFIKKSEKRKEEVKTKAASASAPRPSSVRGHKELGKTLASWRNSRGLKPAAKTDPKPIDTTNITVKSSAERKKAEKEMYERNKRLYSQLEEVKQKRIEDERKQQQATNRERARQYNQKLSESKKKTDIKK